MLITYYVSGTIVGTTYVYVLHFNEQNRQCNEESWNKYWLIPIWDIHGYWPMGQDRVVSNITNILLTI